MPDNLLSELTIDMADADKFKKDLLEVTIENSLHLPDTATFVLRDVDRKSVV